MAGNLCLFRFVVTATFLSLANYTHALELTEQQSFPYNLVDLTNFVARYNLTNNQASELESIIRNASASCEVSVRVQLDYLYTMLAFVEAATRSQSEVADVGLLFPDMRNEVTSTAIFRSKNSYTGRGDGWIADSTTGPCKAGDCWVSGARSQQISSEAAGEGLPTVTMDDMQELPTSLDRNASAPDMIQLVSDQMPPPQLLMYYRYDLFSEHQLVLPATWPDLADWAAVLNGTIDADGDGLGDWALCLDTMPACKSGFLLMAIMASVVQPATEHGTFFEPETMKPLVRTQGFVYALSLFRRLASYSTPTSTDTMSCRAHEPGFFAGQCLVTLSFDQMRVALAPLADAIAAASVSSGSSFSLPRGVLPRDALGVAPLPGSEVLLNRTSGELVPCVLDNCPNAVTASCAINGNFQALRTCRVNRAPLLASLDYDMVVASYAPTGARSLLTGIKEEMTATLQTWAKALLETLLVPSGDSALVMGDESASRHQLHSRLRVRRSAVEDSDTRRSLGTAAATVAAANAAAEAAATSLAATALTGNRTTTVQPLTKLGYSSVEVARFLAVYWGSLLGNDPQADELASVPGPQRNVVQELRIRGSSYFTNIFSQAVTWVLRDGVEPEIASRWADSETEELLELVADNRTRLAFKYCQDIGWNGDDGIGGEAGNGGRDDRLNPPGNSGLSGAQLTAVIVAPVCALSLALVGMAAAAVALRRRRWATRSQAMGPPGPGLGTSLILTDIQNSTVLWESLAADIMDAALRCHHEVVRRLLTEHRGYESATEGDAFILAFHSSEDAARYAVAAQELLVTAPWPEEMLSHPDCEVVWMAPNRVDPVACLSYVNRELLAAASRAAAACRAEGETGAAGSPSLSPRPNVSMLAVWWQRTAACCGCSAGGGGNDRSNNGCNDPASGDKKLANSKVSENGCRGAGIRERDGAAAMPERPSNCGVNGGGDGGDEGGGGGSFSKAIDGFINRITVANRSKKRILESPGDETSVVGSGADAPPPTCLAARGSGGGGGDGNSLLNVRRHLHRLSPLVKSPSDIRSYMTDIEADVELLNHPDQPVSNADLPIDRAVSLGAITAPRLNLPLIALAAAATSSLPPPLFSSPLNSQLRGAAPAGSTPTPRAASRLQQSSAPGDASGGIGGGVSCAGSERAETPAPLLHLSSSTAASTLIEALRQGWRRVPPPGACGVGSEPCDGDGVSDGIALGAEPLLIYRGMRVRMGIHTGADLGEVSLNKATGRTQYSGGFMTVAKAVCDAAHGGQVLISPSAFKRLSPGSLTKAAFLLHMGEHLLAEEEEPGALYQLLPYSLSCRLPTFEPLRTHDYLSLGLPDAPVGRVTVVFMYVIGAQTLLAWNPVVAGDALAMFHDIVSEQIHGTDGYVVELVDGLCLAGFRSAADALLWSLRCGRLLLSAPWSDELLEHELCEEVSLLVQSEAYNNGGGGLGAGGGQWPPRTTWLATPFSTPGSVSGGPQHVHLQHQQTLPSLQQYSPPPQQQPRAYTLPRAPVIRQKTLMRGLRLKVGMDIGFVADSINATTGRMAYRGRPMNRAARIASKALAGQVHCSGAVWEAAAERLAVLARVLPGTPGYGEEEVAATSLGLQSLKGVMGKIEVLSVSYKGTALTPEEVAMVAKRAPRQSVGSSAATTASNPTLTTVTSASGSNAFSALATALSMGHLGTATSGSRAAAAATLGSKRNSFQRRSGSGLPNASLDRVSPVNPHSHRPFQSRLSHSMHPTTFVGGPSISENGVDNGVAAAAIAAATIAGDGGGGGVPEDGLSVPDAEQNSSDTPASETAPCERTRSLYLSPDSPLSSPVGNPSCARPPIVGNASASALKMCAAGVGDREGSCNGAGEAPATAAATATVQEASAVQMSGSCGSFRSGSKQHIVVHYNPLATTVTDAPDTAAAATAVLLEDKVTSNPANVPSKSSFCVFGAGRQNGLIAPHTASWTSKGLTGVVAAANGNIIDQGSAAAATFSMFGTSPCSQAEHTLSSLLPLPPALPAMLGLSASPASPTTTLAAMEKEDQ